MLGILCASLLVLGAPPKVEIKDTVVGTGAAAVNYDFVSVDYRGTLADGTVFDSSTGKEPISFLLGSGSVIPGWDQGLLGMKVGGARTLVIPPDLAYGKRGFPGVIPANATLKFEVSLVKIERAKVEVFHAGTGDTAKVGDTVELHFVGKLADGKEFENSRAKGRTPIFVQVGRPNVMPGFCQGTLDLRLGERRLITVGPNLAFGKKGKPPTIPPDATLTYEIEVLRVIPKAAKR
jgi:FKBP-type peptidyl-prolyl cis-trans isomerase